MPNFLKSLFKPSPPNQSRSSHGGPLPPGVEFSPVSPSRELQDDEIEAIASRLRNHLVSRTGEGEDRTMARLLDLLEESKVTPFRDSKRDSRLDRAGDSTSTPRKGNGRKRGAGEDGQWKGAMMACTECLGTLTSTPLMRSKFRADTPAVPQNARRDCSKRTLGIKAQISTCFTGSYRS